MISYLESRVQVMEKVLTDENNRNNEDKRKRQPEIEESSESKVTKSENSKSRVRVSSKEKKVIMPKVDCWRRRDRSLTA